jgi:hypothetical protein
LLYPAWLFGFLAHRFFETPIAYAAAKYKYIIGAVFCMGIVTFENLPWAFDVKTIATHPLGFSQAFWWQNALALTFALHLISLRNIRFIPDSRHFLVRSIKALASTTFLLYLIHMPVLKLASQFTSNQVAQFFLVQMVVIVVAPFTENKKRAWKNLVDKISYALMPKPKDTESLENV